MRRRDGINMDKITVQALPTSREMEKLLQSLVDDEESDFKRALDIDVSHRRLPRKV